MNLRRAGSRLGAVPVSRALETGFVVLTIYLLSGGWLWAPPDPASTLDPDPQIEAVGRIVMAIPYVVVLLLILKRLGHWRDFVADGWLVVLLALTMVSAVWSAAPSVTLTRGSALLGTSLFGMWLTSRYRLEEQLRLLGLAMAPIVVWCLIRAVTFPGSFIYDDFSGIFEHKNVLGRAMAMATLVFLFMAWTRRPRGFALLFAALSFGLMILAKSATALVVFLTVLSLIPLFKMLKQDSRLAISFSILAVLTLGVATLFATSHIKALTSFLGRDATLTGRTDLWPFVVDMIWRRPWFGYGYESFWLKELDLRTAVDEGAGWRAQHSHNGFLEVGLAMGLVGLTVYTAVLVRGFARALQWMRRQETIIGQWPLICLCFLLLYNLTEVTALARNSIFWVLYVSALVTIAPKVVRSPRTIRRPVSRPAGARHARWGEAPGIGVAPLQAGDSLKSLELPAEPSR